MKKLIYTKTGYQLLTKEEVLKEYDGMIRKFAINCDCKLKTIQGNMFSEEDYIQVGKIEALSAYENYDSSTGVKFSTYLQNSLRYVFVHIVRDLNAQKRKVERPLVELDSEDNFGEGLVMHEMVASKEINLKEDNVCDLEKHLINNLTKEELVFLKMGMQKQVNKAKGVYKSSLNFTLDVINENIDGVNVSTKAELAEVMGISRPTLNKRIKTVMDKTQRLAYEYLEIANLSSKYKGVTNEWN